MKRYVFRQVSGKPLNYRCISCGRMVDASREAVFADIEGEPFKAYYCEPCKNKLDYYKEG